jgi:hypothetical protein
VIQKKVPVLLIFLHLNAATAGVLHPRGRCPRRPRTPASTKRLHGCRPHSRRTKHALGRRRTKTPATPPFAIVFPFGFRTGRFSDRSIVDEDATVSRLACRFAKATSSPSSPNKLNAEAAPSFYGPPACVATACKLAVKLMTTAPKRGLLPRSDGGETLDAASRWHGEGGQRHPSWQLALRSPRLWLRRASTFPLWSRRRPAPPTFRSSMMTPPCRASRPQHQRPRLLHRVREHDAASWPLASRWAALRQQAAASALANGTR